MTPPIRRCTLELGSSISQQNVDVQWIAAQGKDAMNSIGVGAFFNVLNFGQMYGFHIVILPVIVSALVGLHVLLARMRGVVRPYPAPGEEVAPPLAA